MTMKRLKDQLCLDGQVEEITMMELRSRPGEVLTAVEMGKVYIITKNGQRVACLMKLPGQTLSMTIGGNGKIESYDTGS